MCSGRSWTHKGGCLPRVIFTFHQQMFFRIDCACFSRKKLETDDGEVAAGMSSFWLGAHGVDVILLTTGMQVK